VYEGGLRVPFIAWWPGHIPADTVSEHIGANWDMWATFADLLGRRPPLDTDGISIVPTLLRTGQQRQHNYLYWELGAKGGQQAVRRGRWKGVRVGIKQHLEAPLQLYDLQTDRDETRDVAAQHPAMVRRMAEIMRQAHTPSPIEQFNFMAQ
jgi:arylsulfatase A